jgi:hypothetical protein
MLDDKTRLDRLHTRCHRASRWSWLARCARRIGAILHAQAITGGGCGGQSGHRLPLGEILVDLLQLAHVVLLHTGVALGLRDDLRQERTPRGQQRPGQIGREVLRADGPDDAQRPAQVAALAVGAGLGQRGLAGRDLALDTGECGKLLLPAAVPGPPAHDKNGVRGLLADGPRLVDIPGLQRRVQTPSRFGDLLVNRLDQLRHLERLVDQGDHRVVIAGLGGDRQVVGCIVPGPIAQRSPGAAQRSVALLVAAIGQERCRWRQQVVRDLLPEVVGHVSQPVRDPFRGQDGIGVPGNRAIAHGGPARPADGIVLDRGRDQLEQDRLPVMLEEAIDEEYFPYVAPAQAERIGDVDDDVEGLAEHTQRLLGRAGEAVIRHIGGGQSGEAPERRPGAIGVDGRQG